MSGAVTLYLREIEFSETEKRAINIEIKNSFDSIENLEHEIINIEYLSAGAPKRSDFEVERYYAFIFVGGFITTLFIVWAAWDCTRGRKNREKERSLFQISEHTRGQENSSSEQTTKILDLRPEWQKKLSQERITTDRSSKFDWHKHLRETESY